jgi:CTP:molybdopterin cytidylyltransferase MocA
VTDAGAVIVAAGKSSRMGAFKPLLPLMGSTIIEEIIKKFHLAGIHNIVVVTGREADRLSERLGPYGVDCVFNPDYNSTDMFYSAKMGLSHIKAQNIFFLPGDTPLFSVDTLIALMERIKTSDAQILTPLCEGVPGHPVLINEAALPFILTFSGEGGLKGAIASFAGPKESLELPDPGIIHDVDTMKDYELIKQLSEHI